MNLKQIEKYYSKLNKKEKRMKIYYNPRYTTKTVKGRRHAYMKELVKERQKDLEWFGKDPYINPFEEKTKFLKDLKIYMQKGFKHQFDDYKDVLGEPNSPVFFENFQTRAKSLDQAHKRLRIDLRGFPGKKPTFHNKDVKPYFHRRTPVLQSPPVKNKTGVLLKPYSGPIQSAEISLVNKNVKTQTLNSIIPTSPQNLSPKPSKIPRFLGRRIQSPNLRIDTQKLRLFSPKNSSQNEFHKKLGLDKLHNRHFNIRNEKESPEITWSKIVPKPSNSQSIKHAEQTTIDTLRVHPVTHNNRLR
ncbi:unnamed protein product [Moneuplotes crassus]|uniref:Uncharacterized protein n=1 Tax=Euplotes crassus TaxID=5936 RepID=A0AAD1U8J2_EUPCR|nr:unnamed protein product [Moneuplotes crassus]